MASETPSIEKLQAIADDYKQPGYYVKVVAPGNEQDIQDAAHLLEEVWSEGEPLSAAVLADFGNQQRGIQKRFRQFLLDCCQLSSQNSLLLAVMSTESSKMVSLLVGMPSTPDVYPALSTAEDDLMAPWLDILHQLDNPLDEAVNKLDVQSRSSVKILDFFGYATVKAHEGRKLTHLTRDTMIRIGQELGYTHAIGKFSSPWQKAIWSRWGWDYLGEANYHEYEWKGQRPFESIPVPEAVQLAWVKLG